MLAYTQIFQLKTLHQLNCATLEPYICRNIFIFKFKAGGFTVVREWLLLVRHTQPYPYPDHKFRKPSRIVKHDPGMVSRLK